MSSRRKASIAIKNEEPPQGGNAVVAPTPNREAKLTEKGCGERSITEPATNTRSQPTLKLQADDKRGRKSRRSGSGPDKGPLKDAPMIDIDDLLNLDANFSNAIPSGQSEEDAANRVEKAKECLGRLETEIVEALFPAQGSPEPLEDIANRLGMTQKEVREVADNALRGLRGTKSSRARLSTVWN
jgi:hypothetical protein